MQLGNKVKGHMLDHMQLNRGRSQLSCSSSFLLMWKCWSASTRVANLYTSDALHTAACRDKSRGLRRSGRRKARGLRQQPSCCWWSCWGRGQRVLRFPSRSDLEERNITPSLKKYLNRLTWSKWNEQNTYHGLVATTTTMVMMAVMGMIMKRKMMSSQGRSCKLIKTTTVMIAQIMIAKTAIISLKTIRRWWQQECWAQWNGGRWCARAQFTLCCAPVAVGGSEWVLAATHNECMYAVKSGEKCEALWFENGAQ